MPVRVKQDKATQYTTITRHPISLLTQHCRSIRARICQYSFRIDINAFARDKQNDVNKTAEVMSYVLPKSTTSLDT